MIGFLQPLREETLCMVRFTSTGILEIASWTLAFNSSVEIDKPWFMIHFAFKVTPHEVTVSHANKSEDLGCCQTNGVQQP